MMADSVEGEGSNGGGSGNQEGQVAKHAGASEAYDPRDRAEQLKKAWGAAYDQSRKAYAHGRAYNDALTYAHARAYVSLAVKASGLLAFTLLSTVILLGGYVQSLVKEDFFCIMAITVVQAAGFFQDWETNLHYLQDFADIFLSGLAFFALHIPEVLGPIVVFPLLFLIMCVLVLYLLGPLVCAAISSWRISKLNQGYHMDGTDSMADMMATLNIFYSLIIFQGTMFLVLVFTLTKGRSAVANHLLALEQLSDNKWGKDAIHSYISDISKKCRKDHLSIKGWDLIKYGAELLGSESQVKYLHGARLLSAFIDKGEDVSRVLLPSAHRIQRLIDSLIISSGSSSSNNLDLDKACVYDGPGTCLAMIGGLDDKKEIRELAANIVAHVAAYIDDLAKYPGAMRCISSLLQHQEETTRTYRNRNIKQVPDDPPPHPRPIGPLTELELDREASKLWRIKEEETQRKRLMTYQERMEKREHKHRSKREGGTSNNLVQQGLTILERLASNSDGNRRLICSTPSLLPKITAPVYSTTLINDVKTKSWADIVTRCLKVLYQLIRSPGRPSRRLRRQIFSNHRAMSNLESILLEVGNDEADHQELQLVAMKILTELALLLDPCINITEETKQELVTKQLHLFLIAKGDDEEESATIAGRAIVSLSANSQSNSALIMATETGTIGHLTGILDDFLITRRTIAAEIMANLCAHCNVDNMKEILPKVFRKIIYIKGKSQQRQISAGQNNPALGDEENQGNFVSTNNEERQRISTDGDHPETEEISDQEREEHEAFLSLAQVICDKLDSADLDGAIQKAVDQKNAETEKAVDQKNAESEVRRRREAFVDKLKTIIDDNCHPTADSLRMVKLCCQIAQTVMMRCEQYVEIFRNRGFKSSLSEASRTMSELESCMRFVGTDFGHKKTVTPLLEDLARDVAKKL